MDRCSALTVTGHEDFSLVRSLGNPEKALLDLGMTIMIPDAAIEIPLKNALDDGITEEEIQDVVNFAWNTGRFDRATELSSLVAQHRGFELPKTSIVKLGDHETLVMDTAPTSTDVPIILLHALSFDASMWRAIYPDLAKQARVVMYDIRGFGTARDASLPTSVDQVVDDLKALLDVLDIEKADIYGISYGGAIAQTFAINHPSRTRAIAILASLPKGFPILLDRAIMAETQGMESLVSATLIRWFSAECIAMNNWVVRYARTCVRRAKVENWAAAWRVLASFDVVDRLSEIKVPVLAVAGTKDVSSPPALLKIIAEKTGGRYVEIPDGTHMMNLEQSKEVGEILAKFRDEVDGITDGLIRNLEKLSTEGK